MLQTHSGQAVHVTTAPFTVPAWSKDGSRLALDLRLPQWETEIWTMETRSPDNLPKARLQEGVLPVAPTAPTRATKASQDAAWEVRVVSFGRDEKENTEKLSQLAAEGWEYVGPLAGGGSTSHLKKVDGKWKIVAYGHWVS